ncbi:MAG: hypothetical protein ACK5E6_01950 [Cyanobacteriota bacterium]|jgi:hypothetical protein
MFRVATEMQRPAASPRRWLAAAMVAALMLPLLACVPEHRSPHRRLRREPGELRHRAMPELRLRHRR